MAHQERVAPGKVNNLISFFEGHGNETTKSSMEIKQNYCASPSDKQNMVQDFFSNSDTKWAKSEQAHDEELFAQNIPEVAEECEEEVGEYVSKTESEENQQQSQKLSEETNDIQSCNEISNNLNSTETWQDEIEKDKIQIAYQCQPTDEEVEVVDNIQLEDSEGKQEYLVEDFIEKEAEDTTNVYTNTDENFDKQENEISSEIKPVTEEFDSHTYQEQKESDSPWIISNEELPNHLKGLVAPTVYPAAYFDVESDAQALKNAMKGLGTDEKLIIDILTNRSLEQRLEIASKYQEIFEKNLCAELKKELSAKLEDAVIAMMTPYFEYLATELHRAVKGIGTDEKTLIEILCTCDDESISLIKDAYQKLYTSSLQDEVYEDTSGDFRKVLLSILSACREDPKSCSPEAVAGQLCHTDSKGKPALESDTLRTVLVTYSKPFLYHLIKEYEDKTEQSFGDLIEHCSSGDTKDILLALYESIICLPVYYAQELHGTMKGLGTKDSQLIRIIVSRSEIDLEDIKEEFQKLYNKSLYDEVKSETSGDYQAVLLSLIEGCNKKEFQQDFEQESQL